MRSPRCGPWGQGGQCPQTCPLIPHRVGMGATSAGAPSRAVTNPPRAPTCPLPVFVGAEYGLQHHPLFFDGSLGIEGGDTQRDLWGWGQSPNTGLPLNPHLILAQLSRC